MTKRGDGIKVAVSSCLLGEPVRYDGDHKRSPAVTALADVFDFVSVCPEVGIGMGVPRKPIRLVGEPAQARARGVEDPSFDVTDDLVAYASARAAELAQVSGYIFMERSPSCGLNSARLFDEQGVQYADTGRGVFAREITRRYPDLPVEEADRLGNPEVRAAFIRRVRDYHVG